MLLDITDAMVSVRGSRLRRVILRQTRSVLVLGKGLKWWWVRRGTRRGLYRASAPPPCSV